MLLGVVLGVLAPRGSAAGPGSTLAPGVTAAALSGMAVWAISGIWVRGSTRNPNYALDFVSWFIAFLPGFACPLVKPNSWRQPVRSSSHPSRNPG